MSKSKLAVVPSSPPPALQEPRPYRDFDDMVAVIDALDRRWSSIDQCSDDLSEALWTIREAQAQQRPPTEVEIEALRNAVMFSKAAIRDSAFLPSGRPLDDAAIAKMRASVAHYERAELFDDAEKVIISRQMVGDEVGRLLGSFPNAAPHSPQVYTAMLLDEIIAAEPYPIAFEATCRLLRRTETWPPTVAKFLETMRKVVDEWRDRWTILDGPPYLEDRIKVNMDDLARDVADAEAMLARP